MHKSAIVVALSLASALFAQNGVLVTVAGNGTTGTSGVGGPAVNAAITGGAICADGSGNLYIADGANNRVVKVDTNGILTLVAGNGAASSAGDLGPATQASLNAPSGVAVDSFGDLFIAEAMGNRVRAVNLANGMIMTVAGNGVAAWTGDGGPATSASLNRPMGLAMDAGGNLYIADTGNNRVRLVVEATRIITTIAGTGVNAYSPDGTPAASANLAVPLAVSFDGQGNLLITEMLGADIRAVSRSTGLLSTVAGNGGMNFNGDGQPATSAALGYLASNVITDAVGGLYFADGTGRVRRVDAVSGLITTVAGSGAGAHGMASSGGGGGGGTTTCPSGLGQNGPATIATLDGVAGVAFAGSGRLAISDGMDCMVFGVQLPSPLLYTNTGLNLAGQTLTATVTPLGGSVTPTGTVQFMEYESFGPALPLASATLSGGVATVDLSTLTAGSYQVMALYMGDAVYNGSGSAALGVTGGGKATPSMGANVPYPVVVSTPVTLTFTVVGSRGQPTGSVQVLEGATLLNSLTLVSGAGSFSYMTATPGTHQITLQYAGDTNYNPLSWTFSVSVLVPSTLSLSADTNPANGGATVTFTAALSPATGTGRMVFTDNGTSLGSVSVVNGAGTLPVSTLAVGTHSIAATYSGDFVVAPSTSNVLTETITVTATTITLATSGSPSTWNQSVTLNAAITPATASGTVVFNDGATQLGSATLSGGAANLTTTQLAAGAHTLTAVFNATAGYGASISPAVTQTVNKATPVVTVTSSANPVVSPASVTFTANLTPSWNGASLQIMDGQTLLAGASAPTGVITVTLALSPGVHTITAVCPGDANLNQVTSAALSQTVQANTTVTLSAPSGSTVFGQAVTFTASLAPAAASGTVQFSDGSVAVGSAPIVNGIASLTVPALAAGSHPMQASYNGDGTYLASASAQWVQTVSKASTSVVLASSPNPATVGQSVVFTATLLPAAATGSVQFLDGATAIGTAVLNAGTASLSNAGLAAGSHSITVAYAGDANCTAATSAAVAETVTKAQSTASLSVDNGTITYGQNVNLTASVSPAAATGTVQFLDGATVLVTLPVNNGQVQVVTATNLAAGTHAMTAVYSGDAAYNGSTSTVATVTVAKAATTVGLGSSANPAASGQAVVFTATLSPPTATGNVQFLDGATVIGTAAVSGGTASMSTSGLTAGSHSITVAYAGDANCNAATSAALAETVTKAPSTASLSVGSGTIAYGQNVTLTASVSPAAATGTVQFLDGAIVLVTLPVTNGQVQVVTATNLAAGTHAMTAVYSGDAVYNGSTSTVATVTVTKAATTVGLSSSVNPVVSGQAVTFTATLSPPTATGTLQFLDGATVIGTATVSGGTASMSTAGLAAGSHAITAAYQGDANYNAATSSALTQTVTKVSTATAITAGSGTISFGQSVSLIASVTPASATGTVQFMDGATALGAATLSGGSATFIAVNLAVGTHAIAAVYSGDAANGGSSSAAVTVTVVKAGASVTLSSTLNPSVAGQTVTFTAVVSPAAATGSVQFLDGANVIGTVALSGGAASLSTSALAAGSHSVTAVYGGSAGYSGATSGAVTQTVLAVTTTSLSANKSTAVSGQTVTFTATVSPAQATGSVQFLDGATAIGTVTLHGGSAALAVSNLAVGSHSVTASYGGAAGYAASASGAVSVTITAPLPGAPSGLNATAASSSQINLKWNASATSGVTYNIYASTTAGFTPAAGNRIASGVTATSYAHTGLAASTTFYYLVTAQNANGESAPSNQANAKTQAGLACHVDYSVTTQWNVGFGTAITIKNTGSTPINGWSLTWTWAGNQQITQAWNSNYTQSGANATLTNASWNPTIAAGATLSGMGFNASYSGSNPPPAAFYVNGTRCQ